MKFSYEEYYRQDCIVPLLLIIFSTVILLKLTLSMIRKHSGEGILYFIKGNVLSILFFAVFISLITINSIHLLRGGFHLLYEKPQDAIRLNGFVEEIEEIGVFTGSKYSVDQNAGNGMMIVVGGDKYYLMTSGNLAIGDCVCFEVLPQSNFILYIEKVGNNSKTTY